MKFGFAKKIIDVSQTTELLEIENASLGESTILIFVVMKGRGGNGQRSLASLKALVAILFQREIGDKMTVELFSREKK